MKYLVLLLVLILGGGFVFINWPLMMKPEDVDFLVTTNKAPFGIILLIWFGVLFLIIGYTLAAQQTKALNSVHKLTKELSEKSKLASSNEESRLTDVKKDFENRWAGLVDEQKQLFAQTEQKLLDQQNKILDAFKSQQDQINAINQELGASVRSSLDTMDDKITKILISKGNAGDSEGV